jgi:hypothetical protein
MYPYPAGHFPPLPDPAGVSWPADVVTAYAIISNAYKHAHQLLQRDRLDATQLRIHLERILNEIVPLFDVLGPEVDDHAWQGECSELLVALGLGLELAASCNNGYRLRSHIRSSSVDRSSIQ